MDAIGPRCRIIEGLISVRETTNPWPKTSAKGVKAEGLRFERALARSIPGARHGVWFEFNDANGRGYASPDLIAVCDPFTIVIEVKLTDTNDGRDQIRYLYRPLLELAYNRPVRGLVACRNLRRDSKNICTSLSEALHLPDCIPTLHWLGRGPI